jgi:hypothetical protein
MQKKTKFRLAFTKTTKADGSSKTPLPLNTPSPEWYRSIDKLPFSRFVDCSVDKNYAVLTIAGYPTPEQLQGAWNDIQQEVADALGDAEHKLYLSELKSIWKLKVKLHIITDTVELLRHFAYRPFCDRLNKLLFTKYAFDYSNQEQYHKELNACLMRSKSIRINIDLKELNLAAKRAKQGKTDAPVKEPTRAYYQSMMISLSDFAKYPIQNTIMTSEYCERVNRYNDYCEAMDKLYKKK